MEYVGEWTIIQILPIEEIHWQFPTTNTRNPVVRTYTPQSLRRFRYRDNTLDLLEYPEEEDKI